MKTDDDLEKKRELEIEAQLKQELEKRQVLERELRKEQDKSIHEQNQMLTSQKLPVKGTEPEKKVAYGAWIPSEGAIDAYDKRMANEKQKVDKARSQEQEE